MRTHCANLACTWMPAAACCLFAGLAAPAAADEIPYAPYGMDPVPYAVFYRGAWDHYGSDPTPRSTTSDLGFTDVYGLDPIPTGAVPTLRELRHALPHRTLQVLTEAIEDYDPGAPHPMWHKQPGRASSSSRGRAAR